MTLYISTLKPDKSDYSNTNVIRQVIYSENDNQNGVLSELVKPPEKVGSGFSSSIVAGFNGIAFDSKSDKLFVLGESYLDRFENGGVAPLFYYTPPTSFGDFYSEEYDRINSHYIDSIFPTTRDSNGKATSYAIGIKNKSDPFKASTEENILTYGNKSLYAFFPDVSFFEGYNSTSTQDFENQLFKIDPSNAKRTLLTKLDFSVNSLAYDPITINNRLFATVPGKGGDSLYAISLDKLGQSDGIKKIGDIGFSDVKGLVFEHGVLHGFTKIGQEFIIDSISGQGSLGDKKLSDTLIKPFTVAEQKVTGAAATQDKFNIEDKAYLVNKNIDSKSESREIRLNLRNPGSGSDNEKYGGGKIWVITHGWQDNPDDSKFIDLVAAIRRQPGHGNDTILTVDWSDAAKAKSFSASQSPPKDVTQWIKEVADFTFNQLKGWGVTDASQVNLIGHSLGTFVSNELAADFGKAPGFGKVGTLTALEPAGTFFANAMTGPYDLDGLNPGFTLSSGVNFSANANFSRAFLGTGSLASDSNLGRTANESILMDFGNNALQTVQEHSDVVRAFTNLVNSGGIINPSLTTPIFSLDNLKINSEFQTNTFTSYGKTLFDGKLTVGNSQPTVFEGIVKGTTNHHVVYANQSGGSLPVPINSAPTDIYDLFGGDGNDSLFANGSAKTTMTGGAGSDNFIFSSGLKIDPGNPIEITDFRPNQDRISLSKVAFQYLKLTGTSLRDRDFAVVDSINSATPTYSLGSDTAKIIFSQSDGQLFAKPSYLGAVATPFAKLDGVSSLRASDLTLVW